MSIPSLPSQGLHALYRESRKVDKKFNRVFEEYSGVFKVFHSKLASGSLPVEDRRELNVRLQWQEQQAQWQAEKGQALRDAILKKMDELRDCR